MTPAQSKPPAATDQGLGFASPRLDAVLPTNAVLVQRLRDEDDDEEQFRPLEWGLIRRLFTYARPVQGKLNWLFFMSVVRSAQLPAFIWLTAVIVNGPAGAGTTS